MRILKSTSSLNAGRLPTLVFYENHQTCATYPTLAKLLTCFKHLGYTAIYFEPIFGSHSNDPIYLFQDKSKSLGIDLIPITTSVVEGVEKRIQEYEKNNVNLVVVLNYKHDMRLSKKTRESFHIMGKADGHAKTALPTKRHIHYVENDNHPDLSILEILKQSLSLEPSRFYDPIKLIEQYISGQV